MVTSFGSKKEKREEPLMTAFIFFGITFMTSLILNFEFGISLFISFIVGLIAFAIKSNK